MSLIQSSKDSSSRERAATNVHAFSFITATVVLLIPSFSGVASAQPQPDELEFGDTLTIESLTSAVRSRSPRLAAAVAAADAASHRLEYSGALDDPVLSYVVAPNSSDNNIDFSQRLPWPGTRDAREAVADRDFAAAEWGVASEQLMLDTAVKSAFADWQFVGQALQIHASSVVRYDQIVAAAESQYSAGQSSRQDVLQAEVERADLEMHRLQLHREQLVALARINALLDRSPESPVPPAAPIRVYPLSDDESELAGLALRQHPELRRLQVLVARAESQEVLTEKEFSPAFQIRAGYNTLWDETDKRTVFGVSINVPIGRAKRGAALESASAESRRAAGVLADARASVLAETAQAFARVSEAIGIIRLHEDELIPLASELRDAALADYRSGTGAFLNVITAERRLLEAELDFERARAEYIRRVAALERWTGGVLNSSEGGL